MGYGSSMNPDYERPILCRYVDPLELVWLATARRLGLHIRRDPTIYSRTDGQGLLALGPRADLDPDDTLAQQVLHEVCHWLVNGRQAGALQDWGYELDVPLVDAREHATLRVQAALCDGYDLRGVFGPTGIYRQYWALLADPLTPLDDSAHEAQVVALARAGLALATEPPFAQALHAALAATAAQRAIVLPFLTDYATELDSDTLPSWWAGSPA